MAEDKNAFVITPIGSKGSDINKEASGLIDTVITPVLKEMGYIVNNPMNDSSAGSISKQIIKSIVSSDLVIANLTDTNPNVMYELAIRHSSNKPIVTLIRNDQMNSMPFDVKDERTIPYSNELFGVHDLRENLKKHIETAMSMTFNSPVYNATGTITIKNGDNKSVDLSTAIDSINDKINELNKNIQSIKNEDNIVMTKTTVTPVPEPPKNVQVNPTTSGVTITAE